MEDINPRQEFLMRHFYQVNNLVVTTLCNLNCCFCSRKFNAISKKVNFTEVPTKLYHKDFDKIVEEIKLFLPDKVKLVNASISRMTDGEPFTHPKIWDILNLIRNMYPYEDRPCFDDNIMITTNGTYLTKENLKKLEDLKGIVITHSINSTDVEDWMKLSGSTRKFAEIVTNAPRLIKDFDIEYVPSIVPIPKVIGYDGIEKTIRDLHKYGVRCIRILTASYSANSTKEEKEMLYYDENILKDLINKLREELGIKIYVYLWTHNDLNPCLSGFEKFGLMPTDEIQSINNTKIFSRSNALYNFVYIRGRNKRIIVKTKNGKIKEINIESSQLRLQNYVDYAVNFDIPLDLQDLEKKTENYKRILVAHSNAGENMVKLAFKKAIEWSEKLKEKEFYFQTVYNDFYGGNMICAGLLTCQDYEKYIKKFIDENFKPDLILMSSSSFDTFGKDLLGDPIYEALNELGVNFEIVRQSPWS